MINGAKALRHDVVDVFDNPVIARCQLHKLRNVQDRLSQSCAVVTKRMRVAHHAQTALAAQAQLQTLGGDLERHLSRPRPHPCARAWRRH